MVASSSSSSTVRTHLGRVNRDLPCLLQVAPRDKEALVYSDFPREAAAYSR